MADWLIGGGEMARFIKEMDWSNTGLGPIASWPSSLRTVVSLAQASNSPISLAWGPGHVQIYNDGYWPICGEKHPQSMGQDFRECWAAAWPVIGDAYDAALRGETAYLENMRMFLDRNGFLEETWFTFSFSPITDETGSIGGLFHPVTELTNQSLSERRTQTLRSLAAASSKSVTSSEAFETAVSVFAEENLDLPFVLLYEVDENGEQAVLVAQTGLERGSSLCPAVIDLTGSAEEVWGIADVVQSGASHQVDDLSTHLTGSTVGPYEELPNTAMVVPFFVPGQDRPAGVMVAGTSARLAITDVYRGFIELVGASVSTALANARAHEEGRRKAEALEEIDRAKTAFFSNVSHEFRMPLTLMLGPLEDELAEQGDDLSTERRERIETAHRNSMRLLKLVNGLLEFSRLEAGRTQAQFVPTDLALATAGLASTFRSVIERGGLTLTVNCPALSERFYVDRSMWETIVLNLMSNAFKHTFAGGINVAISATSDDLRLTVTDTGVGIAAAELPHLFDRFHRVEGAQSRTYEGTGIGLSLTKDLVELHGGTISVESVEGFGTTFTVRLLAGVDHLPAQLVREADPASAPGRGSAAYIEEAMNWLSGSQTDHPTPVVDTQSESGPRQRVLVADDNADMRRYVSRLLSRTYEVVDVPDGETALHTILESPPDLVISDVMMPKLDGLGLLRALRNDPKTARLPIILLSARAGDEAAVEGLEFGADDYLVKPFSAKELLARVRSCLTLARVRQEWEEKLLLANDALEEATAAKSRFLANMSHEIRTPMNAIVGMTSILENSSLASEQREWINIIRSSSDHLLTVINDILDHSKIESGMLDLESAPFSLRDCVESALDFEVANASAKDVELSYLIGVGVPEVISGDIGRVRQVLLNLISNAVKFTPGGGHVGVEVQASPSDDGYEILIRVWDTGVGIDPAQHEKLFEPFVQGDVTTTRVHGGSGLGLSISRRLCELMGGRIWVDSELGRGSRFSFTISATPGELKHWVSPLRPVASLQRRRVLIVDDIEVNRRILLHYANSWGMKGEATASPLESLEWIERGDHFDIALLDFHMPELDGVELATRIRARRTEAELPIVLIGSAVPDVADAPFSAIALKPLKPGQLVDVITSVLSEEAASIRRTFSPALPSDLGQTHPLRILVAEDNPTNRDVASLIFHSLGYTPDFAEDGSQALQAVNRQPYDVVFMDIQMPIMDGLEATRIICQTWPPATRPLLVGMSANAMNEDRRAGLRAGLDDYITKPVAPALLVKVLSGCPTNARSLAEEPVLVASQVAVLRSGDAGFTSRIIGSYMRDAEELLGGIAEALESADLKVLRVRAHKLAGSSDMMGAVRLGETARRIENAARLSQLTNLPELHEQAVEQFDEVRKALEQLSAGTP